MIKQLLQLVMPKCLGFGFGSAFAIGSTAYNIYSSGERQEDIESAQNRQRAVEQAIRAEQSVRERKKQVRTGMVLGAQAQNIQRTSGSGVGTDTPISTARSAVEANVAANLGRINTALASSGALSAARQDVLSAGRPSTFDIFAQQTQPLILQNIEPIDNFFSKLFSSDTGAGTT